MEQSLADIEDGEKLLENKVVGVHSTDSWQPSQVCLYCMIWAADYAVKFL